MIKWARHATRHFARGGPPLLGAPLLVLIVGNVAHALSALATATADPDGAQLRATSGYLLDKVSAKLTRDQINKAKQPLSEWKPAVSSPRK